MTLLYLARHGETEDNARLVFQGQSGKGLNARGRAQARRLAERMKKCRVTTIVSSDLERAVETAAIVAEVKRLGLEIEYLVNNADFGTDGRFHAITPEKELGQVHCNVSSLVALTGAFLPAMVARGHGRVLNAGSTAGMQVTGPYMATYYAKKSFVNSFTQALAYEL